MNVPLLSSLCFFRKDRREGIEGKKGATPDFGWPGFPPRQLKSLRTSLCFPLCFADQRAAATRGTWLPDSTFLFTEVIRFFAST